MTEQDVSKFHYAARFFAIEGEDRAHAVWQLIDSLKLNKDELSYLIEGLIHERNEINPRR